MLLTFFADSSRYREQIPTSWARAPNVSSQIQGRAFQTGPISSLPLSAPLSLSHAFWHGDHTGGIPDLIHLYPSLSSSIYKHTPSQTQQPITDGQVFRVEGATIRAVHTPGHLHDHMCFVLEEEQAMFTGDAVLGHGTAAVEHLRTWMDTLRTCSHTTASRATWPTVLSSRTCEPRYPWSWHRRCGASGRSCRSWARRGVGI